MRPLPRSVRRVRSGVVGGVLAVLVLTSCGSTDDEPDVSAGDPSGTPSAETTTTPSLSTSPSPSASAPVSTDPVEPSSAPEGSSTIDPTPATGTPVDDLFLTPAEMPGLNENTVWQVGSTAPEDGEPFGDCAKFSLVDSGAESAFVRRFSADGDQSAAQLIATFGDPKSAWRVEQVLRGWHRDCKKQLSAAVQKVGPVAAEKVSRGKAFSYLVQWGGKDAELHHFNGVAINRVGSTISVVLVDTMSQDYNYEPGQSPAEQAARVVADRLD